MEFKAGEIVICIINSRASLTVGKEYKIKEVYNYNGNISLCIVSDNGYEYEYEDIRFIPKSDFRNKIINQIID